MVEQVPAGQTLAADPIGDQPAKEEKESFCSPEIKRRMKTATEAESACASDRLCTCTYSCYRN